MNYFVQFTIFCMYFDIFLPTTHAFMLSRYVLSVRWYVLNMYTWILMFTFFYDLSWFFHNFFGVLCSVLRVSSESDPSSRDRSVSVPAESAAETETLNHVWYRILLSAKYYLSKSSSSWNQQIFYLRVITTEFHIFAIVNSLIGHYCQFISTFILEFLFFLGNFLGFFISLPSYCLFYHTIKLDASYICLLNTYGCFSSSFKYAQAKVYGYFSE